MIVDVQHCVQRVVKVEIVAKLSRGCSGVEVALGGKQECRCRSGQLVEDLESGPIEHDAELSTVADQISDLIGI